MISGDGRRKERGIAMIIENHGNGNYTVDGKVEISVWDSGIVVGGTSSHRLAMKPFYAETLAASIEKALSHYKKASVRKALESFAAYKTI